MSQLADSAVNILLVDDSPAVRTVLRTLLCGLGVTRIYEASTREESFIMARVCRPDLALIDHDLGRASGVDLIAAFRDPAASPMAELPLVMLAPTGMEYLAEQARAAGADAVLPKPVTARMLGERIVQLTGLADADTEDADALARKQA